MSPAWAQAANSGAPSPIMSFAPLVLIFVVFYFLLIRPQQQKTKDDQKMRSNLKKNDDVVTTGGLYGKVVGLTDKVIQLEIAPNVRVRVDRSQIASMPKAAAAEEAKDKEKEKSK